MNKQSPEILNVATKRERAVAPTKSEASFAAAEWPACAMTNADCVRKKNKPSHLHQSDYSSLQRRQNNAWRKIGEGAHHALVVPAQWRRSIRNIGFVFVAWQLPRLRNLRRHGVADYLSERKPQQPAL